MTDSMDLELHIIGPKERRGGKKVIKSTLIRSHEDVLICPVSAFAEYLGRIEGHMEVTAKHPNLQQTYKPLIRSVSDLSVPV
ncbi:hypothetical protein EDD11_001772, partial [Mortierella claussenii]